MAFLNSKSWSYWGGSNYNDTVAFLDGNGKTVRVATGDEMQQNRIVDFNGDTLCFAINSIPNNKRVAWGVGFDAIVGLDATNKAPTAVIESEVLAGDAPMLIRYDISKSKDVDGKIIAAFIDMGDGTEIIHLDPTKQKSIEHVYTRYTDQKGIKHNFYKDVPLTAKLTVVDDKGAMSTAQWTVTVKKQSSNPELFLRPVKPGNGKL